MRKWIITCIAVVMVMAMAGTAFAAGGSGDITGSKAKSIALKNAKLTKSQTRAMEAELDQKDGVWEVEFIKKKNKAEYEYEIDAVTGKIMKKSVDYKYKKNDSKSKIGKKKARKKVAKFAKIKYPIVKKGTCRYEYDDREGTYDVKFRKGNRKYDYEVLAPTGKIIEYSWKYVK